MEIKKNQIDAMNIELKLEIKGDDYAPACHKKLVERRRNAEFKGFRKGNVPMSLIEKFYGEQVLVDSVNDIISEQLNGYIRDNKLNLVGEPMSSEKQPEIEWKSGNDFTFIFDVAVAPEVALDVTKDDVVPKYAISVTEKAIDEMKENLLKYDEKKKEMPEDELKKEAEGYVKRGYEQDAEARLNRDIRDYFVEKAAIELPEAFLKRWLTAANKDKYSAEDIEKDFPGFLHDFRWQMVRDALFKKFDHKIDDNDIREAAASYIRYQYAMYGMSNVPDEIVNESVENVLKDEKQIQRIIDGVEDSKVMDSIKGIITMKPKKITIEKFRELK